MSRKYNLKRIDLYVPQYETDATITVDENHSSGVPHLVVQEGWPHGHKQVASAIPPDWTDQESGRADLSSVATAQRSELAGLGDSSGRLWLILPFSILEGWGATQGG